MSGVVFTDARDRSAPPGDFGLLAVLSLAAPTGAVEPPAPSSVPRYRPNLRPPAALEPILRHVDAGQRRLPRREDGRGIVTAARRARRAASGPGRAAEAGESLLAPSFRGSALAPAEELRARQELEPRVWSGRSPSREPNLDAARFRTELESFLAGLSSVRVAEFLITEIEARAARGRDRVRYDLVGEGPETGRAQRVGRWRMDWRRESDGAWRVAEWADARRRSQPRRFPAFTEVTEAALGGAPVFRRQLRLRPRRLARHPRLRLHARLHGPPRRRRRATPTATASTTSTSPSPRACPTGSSATGATAPSRTSPEAAGLVVLDDTSQSLFADVDNDGDQDLVLVVRIGPCSC